jgi:hypothetical protein
MARDRLIKRMELGELWYKRDFEKLKKILSCDKILCDEKWHKQVKREERVSVVKKYASGKPWSLI